MMPHSMAGGPFPPMGPHPGPFGGPFPFGPQHMGPMHGPGGPMGPGPMGPGGPIPPDRMDHGRHNSYFNQPDYRIHELNKRLQQKSEDSDSLWWDAFATEFFEDDATLTLTFCLEDGPKRYMIGRTLIPRYFRSIFEGGVTELYFSLRHPKESFHNTSITLDCDAATMVTHHGKPLLAKVCTEGRFIVEFTFDDLMRIKSWHFATRGVKELIPRSVLAMHAQQEPGLAEQLGKNITRQGLTNVTLNYLRLCVILEPMQELMTRQKAFSLSPRDCLKTTLFQKWQRMVAPPGGPNHPHSKPEENQRPPSKRRKRKGAAGGGSAAQSKQKGRPPFSLSGQVSDVMVVGEPSLMGGEFGDEDERLITRLENAQTDAAAAAGAGSGGGGGGGSASGGAPPPEENNYTSSPLTSGGSWTSGERSQPPPPPPQTSTPTPQDSQEKKSPAVAQ
ncbi:LIM domain-binding protein 2-like isoform X4 [Amphibalanus amphitrite]|uniref:LIM domain-binding protein 2-like isoform X4 n=1 Tax=Amphibalanus amphitrite TaxID=1232801 RepID=UPI001C92024A|nr:LIM domain-binding protein 2-like isoform X4 [Amphibalanus amphitrite]